MYRELSNGLIIEDIQLGIGNPVQLGKKVKVLYIGKLMNGKVFDKSLSHPFEFRLGVGNVIKGWDLGIKGMHEGGKRRLIIPPSLGKWRIIDKSRENNNF